MIWTVVSKGHRDACALADRHYSRRKVEESNAKARIRGTRKKADNPRADEYFEELLRRIDAAQTYTDGQEIRHWERSFKWLETHHYTQLVEAWRGAERRFEDHERNVRKQKRAGVKLLKGGASDG